MISRGLADLKVAQPGQIDIAYKDVKGGAKLTYKTSTLPSLRLCTSGLMPRFQITAKMLQKAMFIGALSYDSPLAQQQFIGLSLFILYFSGGKS